MTPAPERNYQTNQEKGEPLTGPEDSRHRNDR